MFPALTIEIQALCTSFTLAISITQQPGSKDDADGYNEASRNVAMFEDGGDGLGNKTTML